MSKLLIAAAAAASMLAAAPVFAQGAPQSLIEQSQTSGYQVYAETHPANGVMNAQAQQQNAPEFARNAGAQPNAAASVQR